MKWLNSQRYRDKLVKKIGGVFCDRVEMASSRFPTVSLLESENPRGSRQVSGLPAASRLSKVRMPRHFAPG